GSLRLRDYSRRHRIHPARSSRSCAMPWPWALAYLCTRSTAAGTLARLARPYQPTDHYHACNGCLQPDLDSGIVIRYQSHRGTDLSSVRVVHHCDAALSRAVHRLQAPVAMAGTTVFLWLRASRSWPMIPFSTCDLLHHLLCPLPWTLSSSVLDF